MQKLLYVFVFLMTLKSAHSQTKKFIPKTFKYDTLINLYENEEEKRLLSLTNYSFDDYFALISQIGSNKQSSNGKEKIKYFLTSREYSSQNISVKTLKNLYKDIHNQFLTHYVDNPSFNDIFTSGGYNCATATALYALVLDQLSVKYSIHEKPTHVYMIADPNAANIVFETTTPGMKTLQVTDRLKNTYLKYLVDNKMITQSEASSDKKDTLFEKYFYDDDKIDLKKLAGLLYYNIGIDKVIAQDYTNAYKDFEKAYILYGSKRMEYFVSTSLQLMLDDKQKNIDNNTWVYFLRNIDLDSSELEKGHFKNYWNYIINNCFFENPNPVLVRDVYVKMMPFIKDSALNSSMRYEYYYANAHYYDIKTKLDSSLVYLDSAYALNPQNLLIQEAITKTVITRFYNNAEYGDGNSLKQIDDVYSKYPFLDKKGKLEEIYLYVLAKAMAKSYEKSDKADGERYFAVFQKHGKTVPELIKKSENYFTAAVMQGFFYYVEHKQYKDAKGFLENALVYYPDNVELTKRLKNVKSIIAYKL